VRRAAAIAALVLALPLLGAVSAWREAAPGHRWSFPRDWYAHPAYRTEWWYVTGQLVPDDDPDGEPLGFQQTFFRVGISRVALADSASAWAARDLVMAHAAITDPARDRHVFSEVLWRAMPLLGGFGTPGDSVLAWARAPAGTPGRWSVALDGGGFRLRSRDDHRGLRYDLVAVPARPLVFHGQDGYSPKSADGTTGSLYVSATRMDVHGTVWRDGRPVPVHGLAWLDREIFSDSLGPDQAGWDWLSLQLKDGRDLMLYRLRGKDGKPDFALGTLVQADGTVRTLHLGDWTWEPGTTWVSPETGAAYPVRWRLKVPSADLELDLDALMPNQENVSARSGVHYWEGAVRARAFGDQGPVLGRGYVELTGYGDGSRPPV